MKYENLIKLIEDIAPLENIPQWDNSGVQIHTGKKDMGSVLVCLEINRDIIAEAAEKKADMIITHHPLIFGGLDKVSADGHTGEYVMELIRKDISVYSAHLSFDNAPKGNNTYFAGMLDLTHVALPGGPPVATGRDGREFSYDPEVPGSIGYLPAPMDIEQAKNHVEQCLSLPEHYAKIVDGGKKILEKTGFCTGAGGDFLYRAAQEGCDLFITGDVKLHEAQYAKAVGISLVDAGHYGTEKIFAENFAKQLSEKTCRELHIIRAEANTNPYTIL